MYEILTSDADLARAHPGDATHFVAEQVNGERREPLEGAINGVACWGDTKAVQKDPSRAAVAANGTRAVPEAEGHHWGTICPTDPDYREALLERLSDVGANGDVRLTTLGFPGDSFCHCERCERLFADSTREDRNAWRTDVVTEFVADAADRIESGLQVTLYPDPYPGNLRERAGIDLQTLAPHVDGFYVPLCSITYETTYWVEALARGFARELEDLDASLTIQLAVDGVGVDRLVDLTRQIDPYADTVVYGTCPDDVEVVRETINRLRELEIEISEGQ